MLTRKAKSEKICQSRGKLLVLKQNMIKAIYKITNNINGKSYIGQSVDPHRRFTTHISRSLNDSDNSPIHSAIKKYGRENFSMSILEWTEDYNNREKELILEHNTLSPNGYNVAHGGEEPPHIYGEAHHNSVVTEAQVDLIISDLKHGNLTEPKIGQLFSPPLNQCLIHNINWGITHRRENETYPIRTDCPYNLSIKEVDDVKWLLENTKCTMEQIADFYHVNTSTIKHINVGRNYYDGSLKYPIRTFRGKKQVVPVETILAKRSTATIDT